MSALHVRTDGIIPHSGVDLSAATGKLVKADGAGSLAVNDSAAVAAMGVVLEGNAAAKDSSIGILGAINGTVRMKAGGAGKKFDKVQQKNDGTVQKDAGAGARVIVGIAGEDFADGDLFEVAAQTPQTLA
jgi:hypothetical protein